MRNKKCNCPRCRGLPTADPEWGFDRAQVPKVECLVCGQPIGQEPYVLDTGLARFGTMLFLHQRCDSSEEEPDG